MENAIRKLNEAIIVSRKDIMTIRMRIEEEYPNKSKMFKAEKLLEEVNIIIDEHLHSVSSKQNITIRTRIIDKCLMSMQTDINKKTILDELIELDTSEEEVKELLKTWIKKEYHGYFTDKRLLKYIKKQRIKPFEKADEMISFQEKTVNNFKYDPVQSLIIFMLILILVSVSVISYTSNEMTRLSHQKSAIYPKLIYKMNPTTILSETSYTIRIKEVESDVQLPNEFKFRDISKKSLNHYLEKKNSILTNDEYLDIILKVAEEKQINPILLIAIIGQEQGFVPQNHRQALRIINNPFNVFGSWIEYNTNLEDSTYIATETLIKRLSKLPPNTDPFIWINKTYAEDTNWWKGVKYFFYQLNDLE